MMMNDQNEQQKQVVHVSLTWLLLGVVVIVLLGMGGGLMASLVWSRPNVPLTDNQETITTTVQQVTISPNKAAAEVVAKADKSIVGIAAKDVAAKNLLANGVVVTNDGLVVTSAILPTIDLVAIDHMGLEASLGLVGRDELYGLTYFKFNEGVVGPLDVRQDALPAGNELFALSRARITFLPQVEKWQLKEWVLPPEISPSGIQRLWRGTALNDATVASGALIDDDGRLAGLLTNGPAGLAITADDLLVSMHRLARGERERDPLRDLGIRVHYDLQTKNAAGRSFEAQVLTVEEGSPAALAGVKGQDIIVSINGNNLSWDKSFINQIAEQVVREITVRRGNREDNLVVALTPKPT